MKIGCEAKKKGKKLPVLPNRAAEEAGIKDSRASYWRAAALIALNLLMVLHVVQWWLMGYTISPIEPSEAMFTLQNGVVNAGFIFFTLAILATLIFGRFICGWGCHVLALQDLCAWLLKKIGLKPKPFRSRLLVFVPLIFAIYMFIWPSAVRFMAAPKNEPLIPQFTNHIITTDFWATFPPVAVAVPFLFICGFMTVYFLGQKGFCTYACPYGGFFGLADQVSPGKIRVTDACNQCGHCTATCTSNVIVHAEVKQYGMVVDPGCMKCMDCVSVCPNEALYFGFGKPSVAVSKKLKKNYSLNWPEEIAAAAAFALSLFAVWNVYQLIPMLMALGIACVSTFLFIKLIKLARLKDQSFYRFNLKQGGKMKTAGWVFALLSFTWLGLNIHSGWIRYYEAAGTRAYEAIRIPDELALAQADPAQWLSASDKKNIAEGKDSFRKAISNGLLTNAHALPKYAWIEHLSGNSDSAVAMLAKAADHQEGQARALSLYYRGALLNRIGRAEEAISSLDMALKERPDLVLAREEKGESLWRMGREEEAVASWKEALNGNPNLPLANSFLAAGLRDGGNPEQADIHEKQAEKLTPPDAAFNWMLALRLQNIGMGMMAEKYFQRAIQLNPAFKNKYQVLPKPAK